MPVTALPDSTLWAIFNQLSSDGHFSKFDAGALAPENLSAAQKAAVAAKLTDNLFQSSAEKAEVFGILGLNTAAAAASTAGSSELLGKVKGKLVELAKKQIYKPYDLKITDVALGEQAGVALKVKAQLIDPKDPLITEDKNRASYSAAHAPTTWAITGGGIYPHAAIGTAIPIAPGVSANVGFSAGASLGYSVLAPYPHAPQAALELAKNATVDLPFTAARAKALVEGTEITLRGSGTIAASASIGAGYQLAQIGDLVSVGATAGGSLSSSKNLDLALRIKRLDGNKVFVSLSKVDTKSASISAGAHAGIDLKLKSALPDLGGAIYNKAGSFAADQVEKQVEKWINLDFRATHTAGNTENEVANYVIDLTTATGRGAYEDLLKLDLRKVDQLVSEGDLSVRTAKLNERTRSASNTLKGQFGPITLLSSISSGAENHGTLSTSQGNIVFDRATLADSYEGLISNWTDGKRSISRELVATQKGEAAPSYYYHVNYGVDGDDLTSKDDVRRFLELADLLGAIDPATKALASSEKFQGSFEETSRQLDVYVTDAGLAKLGAAPPEAILSAFGQAYERLDQPWKTHYLIGDNDKGWKVSPWANNSDPKYAQVMKLLAEGPLPSNGGHQSQEDANTKSYRSITGRSLARDQQNYKAAKSLVKLVGEMAAIPTADGRIHHLAEQDRKLGLDFWKALAAVSIVAGQDQVLVNQLAIIDKTNKKDVVLKSEGAIQDPRTEINARLNAVD